MGKALTGRTWCHVTDPAPVVLDQNGGIGERHGMSVLTAQQVREIREWSRLGMGYRQLAQKFGVHQQTIAVIIQGKAWKHVE